MTTLGIELCDTGLQAAVSGGDHVKMVPLAKGNSTSAWPGFAYHDGNRFHFGRAAEDAWFVHPRAVSHNFLAKLSHEPAALSMPGKQPSFSELSYFFLRDYMEQLAKNGGPWEKVVLAVPGSYLKDQASEEEKIGHLLGIAGELKMPLAGIVDLGCAALCDPQAPGFNAALPVLLVDVHLQGTDLSLLVAGEEFSRMGFLHLPQWGSAQLLKHLTGAMGNRFLRNTAFDILADGKIEQTFFRQTKDFVTGGASEYHFHINTAKRAYEMLAKSEQLAGDAQDFVSSLVRAMKAFLHDSGHAPESCTTALTDRSGFIPGLASKLNAEGFRRMIPLSPGAAARGAAQLGSTRFLKAPEDLGDVLVEKAVRLNDVRRAHNTSWQAHLHKSRAPGKRLQPTHAIIDGVGFLIGGNGRFTIGAPGSGADVSLPEAFSAIPECAVPFVREEGRIWFVDDTIPPATGSPWSEHPPRSAVEAGDRLAIRSGTVAAEVLFAHCGPAPGAGA